MQEIGSVSTGTQQERTPPDADFGSSRELHREPFAFVTILTGNATTSVILLRLFLDYRQLLAETLPLVAPAA